MLQHTIIIYVHTHSNKAVPRNTAFIGVTAPLTCRIHFLCWFTQAMHVTAADPIKGNGSPAFAATWLALDAQSLREFIVAPWTNQDAAVSVLQGRWQVMAGQKDKTGGNTHADTHPNTLQLAQDVRLPPL